MVEAKHADAEEAARWELSEEARLRLGSSSRLVPLGGGPAGFAQDKYSSAFFRPFLALDCEPDTAPRDRDAEERISTVHVTEPQLRAAVHGGRMNVPSSAFALLALEWLRAQGHLDQINASGTGG